jgi:hypothetical protein
MRPSGAGFDYPKTNLATLIPLTAAAAALSVIVDLAGRRAGVVARIPLLFLGWR